MRNGPTVSVIMGIYNCADTLREAVESILNQTYHDWELIMCDDGSIDDTFRIAEDYKNKYPNKIVLLKNENNMGLNYTLNRCLEISRGTYIARMDGDDRCMSDRFEKELFVLESEKDIDIVSTDMYFFDETGIWGKITHPEYPVKRDFVHESPFCHAPCMVRRESYTTVNGYSESKRLLRVEDYHLWLKMYKAGYKGKNIHEGLYEMRDDRSAYKRRKFKYRLNEAYIKILAVREFHLPFYYYIFAFKPILVGILPNCIYDILHKKRLNA